MHLLKNPPALLPATSEACRLPRRSMCHSQQIPQLWLKQLIMVLSVGLILSACTGTPTTPPTLAPLAAPTETADAIPTATLADPMSVTTPALEPTEAVKAFTTASPTLDTNAWQQAPIVPQISDRALQVLENGLALGNNPRRFSKIGDSETFTSWFLAPFDKTPPTYRLGEYAYLLHQPGYVFILLGTNDIWHLDTFEGQMRRIIEYSIEAGVLPILGTKADNLEGDGSINRTLYSLALEYELPLWNFWAAVQDLPQAGLDEDQAHLTFGYNYFDNEVAMLNAWPVRNLTALQVLDSVLRATQP
jgi:hypothetical protein